MKNLYPKGKGKIHPSPAASPSVGGCGSSESLAVLKLLPVAFLALTAALAAEDKEVLAYLMTRSISGPVTETAAEERRRCRGVHRAVLDCGCFDCYTSFWSRWDCSPDRELIHQAIEAFEEHLATSERGGGGKGRRRERNRSEKGKKGKDKDRKRADAEEEKVAPADAAAVTGGGESCSGEMEYQEAEVEVEVEAVEVIGNEFEQQQQLHLAEMGGERRRGWPDVMGLFNPRLWSVWSPVV